MSTGTLTSPRIHWSDEARDDLGTDSSWFNEFDRTLKDLVEYAPLTVREDADTWYVVNDNDVTFPLDASPNLGLDTWEF